jgi:hypothetical protein
MINELKSVCCFDFNEYDNIFKKTVELNISDNLNNCKIVPCQYFTLLPETAQTILNTPWGTEPFPFSMEVLKTTDNAGSFIQIIPVGGEWRRRLFKNTFETWWGRWINISKALDFIRNVDENTQKNICNNWNKYMLIDENNHKSRKWAGSIATIDKIIDEIKKGIAKFI